MFRLTREVRFGLDETDARERRPSPEGKNGHAGRPAIVSAGGRFFIFRLTIEGEPDAASGYLRNIKHLDDAVRRYVVGQMLTLQMKQLPQLRKQSLIYWLVEFIGAQRLGFPTIVAAELALSPFLTLGWRREDGPDVIRLSQRFEFSAAHRLHNAALSDAENVALFGKCNNPHGHGHNYELQVTLAGEPDEKTGTLMDVGSLERIVAEHVIDAYDHKFLNVEVEDFATVNPSVEYIARAIYRRLVGPLTPLLSSVTVWETPKTWCEYSE